MTNNVTDATLLSSTVDLEEVAFYQKSWKGFIVVPSVMLIYNLWVVTAFVSYAKTTNAMERRSRRDMNGGLIYKAALASECLSLFRYISTLAMYFVGLDANAHVGCLTIVYINNVFFVAPLIAMYVFLWGRQRAFYQHPLIGGLFSRSISILSKISLGLIVTFVVISLCLEMSLNRYESSAVGCRFAKTHRVSQFRFIGYSIVWISGQAMMMGLFIYPLSVHSKSLRSLDPDTASKLDKNHMSNTESNLDTVHHHNLDATRISYIAVTPDMRRKFPQNNVNNNAKKSSGVPTVQTTTKSRREIVVYSLMRRTLYLACVSIASDVTAMGVSGFLVLGNSPYYVMCLFLDANTTVNVTTVLFSFRCWKEMLFFRNQCCSCLPGTCRVNMTHKSTSVDSHSSSELKPKPHETVSV